MEVVLFYLPITIDLDEHLAADVISGCNRPLHLEWTVVNSPIFGYLLLPSCGADLGTTVLRTD